MWMTLAVAALLVGADAASDVTPPLGGMARAVARPKFLHHDIQMQWKFEDRESGIARYEWAIGKTPGAWDWTGEFSDAGTAEGFATNLPFDVRTYYLIVRAFNRAGMSSEVTTNIWFESPFESPLPGQLALSDGASDRTPPFDGMARAEAWPKSPVNKLQMSWAFEDYESGVARYEWAIGTTPEGTDRKAFSDAGTDQGMTTSFVFDEGRTYYLTVRAFNRAGLHSQVTTNVWFHAATPVRRPKGCGCPGSVALPLTIASALSLAAGRTRRRQMPDPRS